ncbi:hypothetical protein FIV42_18915 [Persicimonas caeni]|uniref:DUF1302 domain-containing protein n=1 Tax=Persicimonas caeni TaxID=2292766 RepID=A0A4Y6PWP5_PERCE|nr:hypothetical protein [Persicimonas caeni]QDG52736.1 hypothetical protein FIV42_18915 [Persicimonas caeni]QED33958.1 hypothetical protein FRD00_18910 [Persicimonas caeni]
MPKRSRHKSTVTARRLAAVCVVAVVLAVSPPETAASDEEAVRGGAAVEMGYGQLGEDSFLNLRLKLGYTFELAQIGCDEDREPESCQTQLRLAAQAPLRLRVQDATPSEGTLLRRADWDEPGDYLRVIRTVEYGHPTETLHAKIGELGPVSLGHGTVVGDFYNVVTVDHYHLGVTGTVNTVYGGFEMLLDDVIAPSVVGGRAFVHPWSFVDTDSILSRVAVGATVVSDVNAPSKLAAADTTSGRTAVDDTYNPVVTEDQATGLLGVDLEVTLLDSEHVGVVPYADYVRHTSLGSGLHAGTFISVRPNESLEFLSKLEYRRVGENYLPDYVGPLYAIERYQFKGWGLNLPAPKVRAAASIDAGASHGFSGSITARMHRLFSVTATYADHQGPANQTVRFRASARPVETVQLGLFYHKQNFDEFSQVLDLDGALVVAESRVGIYGPVFALGTYGRMWRLADNGQYQTIDDWNVGLGASMGF